MTKQKSATQRKKRKRKDGSVSLFNGKSTLGGYFMPEPSSQKNRGGAI